MALRKPTSANPLPILPLRNQVLFPGIVTTIQVTRETSLTAIEAAMDGEQLLWVARQMDPDQADPKPEDLESIGTVAEVLSANILPDGTARVALRGMCRARYTHAGPKVVEPRVVPQSVRVAAQIRAALDGFTTLVGLCSDIPVEAVGALKSADCPGAVADQIAHHCPLSLARKQALLDEDDPVKRLETVTKLVHEEVLAHQEKLRIQAEIEAEFASKHRTLHLEEQIRHLNKELSELIGGPSNALQQLIGDNKLPPQVLNRIQQEWQNVEENGRFSSEATVSRIYVETLCRFPWEKSASGSKDALSVQHLLDSSHFGLKLAKRRISELLAVRELKRGGGACILLVGPPGVGKTSFALSVAQALGLPYGIIGMGGLRDECEIRGHRRSYVGARPGRLAQTLIHCECHNPVIILDEIDKVGRDERHDPMSALLDALDPSQNSAFVDQYLELGIDLSQTLFIATANDISKIPGPVLDRFEVVQIEGYGVYEKREMLDSHLWPKSLQRHGLNPGQLELDARAKEELVQRSYAEAGLRGVERELNALARAHAIDILGQPEAKIVVTAQKIEEVLGKEDTQLLPPEVQPGLPGTAWCLLARGAEGAVGMLEVVLLPTQSRQPQIRLTGALGEVLRESVITAITAIRKLYPEAGEILTTHDIHVHMPVGSVPKDGPSAGLPVAIALVSAALNLPTQAHTSVTGEITLNGQLIPIGGIKAKLQAANLKGIKKMIVPLANASDPAFLDQQLLGNVEIQFATDLKHAIELSLP